MLQISGREFRQRATDCGWTVREGKAGSARYDRQKILKWRATSVAISSAEASRKVGVDATTLRHISEGGSVRRVGTHGNGRFIDLHRDDISALESLMDAANPFCNSDLYLSLSAAIRRLSTYQITVGHFANALLGGQIKVYGSKKDRLLYIEVSVAEVVEWLATFSKVSRNARTSISESLVAAAKRYACEKEYLKGSEFSLMRADQDIAKAA